MPAWGGLEPSPFPHDHRPATVSAVLSLGHLTPAPHSRPSLETLQGVTRNPRWCCQTRGAAGWHGFPGRGCPERPGQDTAARARGLAPDPTCHGYFYVSTCLGHRVPGYLVKQSCGCSGRACRRKQTALLKVVPGLVSRSLDWTERQASPSVGGSPAHSLRTSSARRRPSPRPPAHTADPGLASLRSRVSQVLTLTLSAVHTLRVCFSGAAWLPHCLSHPCRTAGHVVGPPARRATRDLQPRLQLRLGSDRGQVALTRPGGPGAFGRPCLSEAELPHQAST